MDNDDNSVVGNLKFIFHGCVNLFIPYTYKYSKYYFSFTVLKKLSKRLPYFVIYVLKKEFLICVRL